MRFLPFLLGLACFLNSPGFAQVPPARNWKTAEGQTFAATLIRVQGELLELRLPNGKLANFPIARLSPEDQAFVKGGATPAPKATPAAPAAPAAAVAADKTPPRVAPEKRVWPPKVEVDNRAIEVKVIAEQGNEHKYVYRSQAFEFTSEDKLAGSVMKEIARTFEATRSLVEALPWQIEPKPPAGQQFYQAKFFVTRESYIAAGGPPNSGGVYMSRDRVFRVPFPSLGLQMRGKTWFKDENYRGDTIIHEITHQMMHDYLPFLPVWVIEGTAEYTEMLPYNAGRFLTASHERGIKEYIKKATEGGVPPNSMALALDHMSMNKDAWHSRADQGGQGQHRLYVASCVLVYYFCHLDGDGKGTRFFKYLDKIREARDAWSAFFNNPRVKLNPDGRFSYPSDLSLPTQAREDTYGLEQLAILLDGRDKDKLQKDVVDGYKKIGVRW